MTPAARARIDAIVDLARRIAQGDASAAAVLHDAILERFVTYRQMNDAFRRVDGEIGREGRKYTRAFGFAREREFWRMPAIAHLSRLRDVLGEAKSMHPDSGELVGHYTSHGLVVKRRPLGKRSRAVRERAQAKWAASGYVARPFERFLTNARGESTR